MKFHTAHKIPPFQLLSFLFVRLFDYHPLTAINGAIICMGVRYTVEHVNPPSDISYQINDTLLQQLPTASNSSVQFGVWRSSIPPWLEFWMAW